MRLGSRGSRKGPVYFATSLHDPEGRTLKAAQKFLPGILEMYGGAVVMYTAATSPQLLNTLQGAVIHPLSEQNEPVGIGRRLALQDALEAGAEYVHLCDLDRILHWFWRYPAELRSVVEQIPSYDYLITGRTDRAFATHPRVQRDTEAIINHVFSTWFGETIDVTAGSFCLSQRGAEAVLRETRAVRYETDTEWPAIVRQAGLKVGYLALEGLEFETPDYFADEIAAAGSLEAWLEERSASLDAWIHRTRIVLDALEGLDRVIRTPR